MTADQEASPATAADPAEQMRVERVLRDDGRLLLLFTWEPTDD